MKDRIVMGSFKAKLSDKTDSENDDSEVDDNNESD